MSKRTEQRLRAQIKRLERNLRVMTEALALKTLADQGYKDSQPGAIVACGTFAGHIPAWLEYTCRTAWAADMTVVLTRHNVYGNYNARIVRNR